MKKSKPAKVSKKVKTKPLRIAVVTSRFNEEITTKLEDGAFDFLEEIGAEIFSVRVPGAIEIPLAIQALFQTKKIDGAVALGAVIRGETTHYDYVCQSVERGCSELMLQFSKPVGFGVLTTENEDQALARAGGDQGNKGYESAQVVVEMIGLLKEIKSI
ncbi:MAG: 6,7-dimethyl-8-ribityllumazine synthase [Bdellovibrionales bacterium RIFCSPHIGHO2_01_FULL_40_29]|nr:MAG: 6,7-dimethyl-8-ribityllumazine synthase [Bdellovibrionales bacterium RIFCSPHIGHO2_01_FULL_40_29]OFZ33938.1 MAG: 6,7-dimethyl-8-ribityllumazine synthase [Bdellovibrionales bacterium RIFCSPHIGHO2_02_FULL_40_15]